MAVDDANVYDIGDGIILQGTFKDRAAVLADPTTVVCQVLKPDGTIDMPSNAKAAGAPFGVFEATYVPAVAGDHYYSYLGTGAVKSYGERRFVVRERKVA